MGFTLFRKTEEETVPDTPNLAACNIGPACRCLAANATRDAPPATAVATTSSAASATNSAGSRVSDAPSPVFPVPPPFTATGPAPTSQAQNQHQHQQENNNGQLQVGDDTGGFESNREIMLLDSNPPLSPELHPMDFSIPRHGL